jgi:SSS family solute:Na+ symporter
VVSPGILQKVFAAKSDAAVRWGVGLNAAALLAYAAIPAVLGAAARASFPELPSPELALPTLLLEATPPLVGSLGIAAVFSAEISAADAVLFMISTSLTQDVYRRFVDPVATESRLLSVARGAALASGIAAITLAVVIPTVIGALSIFYTLLTVSLFVPVLAGLWTDRGRVPAALSAIAAGILVALLATFLDGHGRRSWDWLPPCSPSSRGAGRDLGPREVPGASRGERARAGVVTRGSIERCLGRRVSERPRASNSYKIDTDIWRSHIDAGPPSP